ncbi:MAG: FGGY family carbohydrate kinase, partial [Armatimonadota bacterium]
VWTQLKADVLNTLIKTVAVSEAGCLGAALLACGADTGEDVRSLANKWVRVTGEVRPNPKNAEYYESRFREYLKLYPVIKELY